MQLRHLAQRAPTAGLVGSPRSAPQTPGRPPAPDPKSILNSIGEVIYDWDIGSDRLTWGPNVRDVLDFASVEDLACGRHYGNLLSAVSPESRYEAIARSQDADQGSGVAYRVCYALEPMDSGARRAPVWIEDTGRWFGDASGKPAHAHGLIRVITAQREADEKLQERSRLDPATGALNRASLTEHIQELLERTQHGNTTFVVLLAAIENLFVLNRTYGYDAADQVIAGIVTRLRAEMRGSDIIARYAGNKFALVLAGCDGEQMKVAARRFVEAVAAAPLQADAGPIQTGLRIGGVIAPRHGRSAQTLFRHAEEALDLARQSGSGRFAEFEHSLSATETRLRALRTADDILSGLNQGRLNLAFQPVVRLASRSIAFEEALLRLPMPDGTITAPSALLPVAEKAGLVALLDSRVLDLAVARLQQHPAAQLSINVSAATLHDPDWPDRLRNTLLLAPGVAERLIVEITETSSLVDLEAACAAIAAMKSLGLRTAMDDFGAGHTSFKNLRRLGFDLVKIDGAFIQNLPRSPDDRFFVRALLDLAQHLNIETVAEWVEDAETAQLLADWGVDYAQGNFFGEAQLASPAAACAAA
ncbi:MAG: bifunctional diguanylate cyclase/phosphodiesterase [Methylobacteriaceae bacterium]|nr:bifunctional diguanylate cyclase/phosphodiesterase [Methylobacteriaceae bacterium]